MRACIGLSLICAAAGLGGCGSTENGDGGGAILLQNENNYSSESSLSIPTVETAAATDLDICWSDVTEDIQCHAVDPQAHLDNVALLRILNLSKEQVEEKLAGVGLAGPDVAGYVDYQTDHEATCARLSDMSFVGTEIDIEEEYVESDDFTYMLLFTEGTNPGIGARTMAFLEPTSSSTNTSVEAPAGCGLLEFSADISSAEPVSIPVDGPWMLDWRNVTADSLGNEIVYESIDSALVGFFEGMTLTEIEEDMFDLEENATSLWELELTGGRTADLAGAQNRAGGERFDGFTTDADGIWLLALLCGTCPNPSPVVLAVLEPSEDG
jgi:hypothetical protein